MGLCMLKEGGPRGCYATRESPPTTLYALPACVGLVFYYRCQVNEDLQGEALVATETEATVRASVFTKKLLLVLSLKDTT